MLVITECTIHVMYIYQNQLETAGINQNQINHTAYGGYLCSEGY